MSGLFYLLQSENLFSETLYLLRDGIHMFHIDDRSGLGNLIGRFIASHVICVCLCQCCGIPSASNLEK